jgi:molybdopterin-containing oxidoreductase family membrane subunit
MGLSAGSLVLAALPVLGDLPKFRPYAKLAAFIALAALVVGGLFIQLDIGKPERLWRIVLYARPGSPLLWDVALTVVYLAVSTLYLWRLMKSGKIDLTLKLLAWLALLAGVADSLTGFVFATQVAHEFWFSAVQPIAFFVAALASAGALILLVMVALRASGYAAMEPRDLFPVTGLTAAALGVDLLLLASEIVTLAFTRSANALELVQALSASPLFWIELATAIGAIVLLLLPLTRNASGWLAVAAALALVDLAVKRVLFVQMGFVMPNMKYPGVAISPAAGSYTPSLVEWGLVVGLVGLFALLLTIGFRALRLGAEAKV